MGIFLLDARLLCRFRQWWAGSLTGNTVYIYIEREREIQSGWRFPNILRTNPFKVCNLWPSIYTYRQYDTMHWPTSLYFFSVFRLTPSHLGINRINLNNTSGTCVSNTHSKVRKAVVSPFLTLLKQWGAPSSFSMARIQRLEEPSKFSEVTLVILCFDGWV